LKKKKKKTTFFEVFKAFRSHFNKSFSGVFLAPHAEKRQKNAIKTSKEENGRKKPPPSTFCKRVSTG
jgi:hypothetical protein